MQPSIPEKYTTSTRSTCALRSPVGEGGLPGSCCGASAWINPTSMNFLQWRRRCQTLYWVVCQQSFGNRWCAGEWVFASTRHGCCFASLSLFRLLHHAVTGVALRPRLCIDFCITLLRVLLCVPVFVLVVASRCHGCCCASPYIRECFQLL